MILHAGTVARAALLALLTASAAVAQIPSATVKVGNENKLAFGTVVALQSGDTSCLVEFRDDNGRPFFEAADFDFCTKPKQFIGKRVALTYRLSKVLAESCQGDVNCGKSDLVPLVVGMKSAGAPIAAKQSPHAGQTSFCTEMETIVFACRTGAKLVSVCAGKASTPSAGMLQYRFGTPDSRDPLDLVWPTSHMAPAKAAHGENVPFAGGGGAWLRIPKGDHAYVVYTGIGKWGPKGETRTKAGITVERNGKAIAQLKCRGEPLGELGPDWFEKYGVTAGGKDFAFPD